MFRLLAVSILVVGCRTPCQRLCVTLADYAEDCGLDVPAGQLETCLDEQSDGDQAQCRRTGDPDTVRREWTCDDVEAFLQGS